MNKGIVSKRTTPKKSGTPSLHFRGESVEKECGVQDFFPKSYQAGYLMINRASVPMWGIVGQSAGPPKWAGKKSDCRKGSPILRHGSDFIYTKNSARPDDGGDLDENGCFQSVKCVADF